jgi:hypothetical protein
VQGLNYGPEDGRIEVRFSAALKSIFSITSKTALRPTECHTEGECVCFSTRVKRQEREADNLLSYSVGVKYGVGTVALAPHAMALWCSTNYAAGNSEQISDMNCEYI